MSSFEHSPNDEPMRLVVSHLETPPTVGVPENFAAQVCAALPTRAPRHRVAALAPGATGLRSLVIATAVLVLLGVALAPLAARGNLFWQTAEYVDCAQVFAFVLVLSLHRRTSAR